MIPIKPDEEPKRLLGILTLIDPEGQHGAVYVLTDCDPGKVLYFVNDVCREVRQLKDTRIKAASRKKLMEEARDRMTVTAAGRLWVAALVCALVITLGVLWWTLVPTHADDTTTKKKPAVQVILPTKGKR